MGDRARQPRIWVFVVALVMSGVLPLVFFAFPRTAAEFGDTFGFMAAVMGGLALFYLSWSVWYQAKANQASVRALRANVKISAMIALVEHQRALVEQYRAWEQSARSEDKRALWERKRRSAQDNYRELIRELRMLADIALTIDEEGAEGVDGD